MKKNFGRMTQRNPSTSVDINRKVATDENNQENDDNVDEEDDEPKLKYQRIGASLHDILRKDNGDFASCLAVIDKFLALGTHNGVIHILDFNGNQVKVFNSHSASVNELSIDDSREYLASCGNDGKVVIHGLYTNEKFEYEFSRPVTAVALDPQFAKTKKPKFVMGGKSGQLLLHTKGFFGPKTEVLHEKEGPIYAIKWRGSLIAWANDLGVKIWDLEQNQRITFIDRPKDSPRPDAYRCCLVWESDVQLIIGWGDFVKIGRVRQRTEASAHGLPSRYVEIVAMFRTDYIISGIAPFGSDLVILSYTEAKKDDANTNANDTEKQVVKGAEPELRIVTRDNGELSLDVLSIQGFENYKATDYRLEQMPNESMYYIVAPKDIVVARPRDLDDHISWLLEREMYEEALAAAEGHEKELRTHNLFDIGQKYIDYLLMTGNPNKAAQMCPKVLKRDAALWETWVLRFFKANQLKAIIPYLPVGNPLLKAEIYETVLNWQLREDHEGLFQTITEWPHTLYELRNVITAINDRLSKDPKNSYLLHSLAKLYTYAKQYDQTLKIYLRLSSGPIFEFIKQNDLYDAVADKVLELMKFDSAKAVDLLLNNITKFPVPNIVQQLKPEPKLLLIYLHNLFNQKKEAVQYDSTIHDLQIELYAEYDPSNLRDFLEKSNSYNLDKAYEICKKKQLWREMVFLLGRMGNTNEALSLLIEKLKDIKEAIKFVEKHSHDQGLWDELINKSINNADFVACLLENIGSHINPLTLISKIPKGLEIKGLRNKLVKIINDYTLQTSLSEGCRDVLKADCVILANKLYEGLRQGHHIDDLTKCSICNTTIFSLKKRVGIVVFFCRHIFHQTCFAQSEPKRSLAAASTRQNDTAVEMQKQTEPFNSNINPVDNQKQAQESGLQTRRQGLRCPLCGQEKKDDKKKTKNPNIKG